MEFGSPVGLKLADSAAEHPGEGTVKVRVAITAVNHIDRLVIGGRFKWVPLPRIPGSEYVGTVEEIGSGVKGIFPGDRVAVFPKMFCGNCRYCLADQESVCLSGWNPDHAPVDLSTNMLPLSMNGGWAEETLIPARNVVTLPDDLSFDSAFAVPLSGMTAWHMVERARPNSGENAVVMGSTGGIGLFAIQILKLRGCNVMAVVNDSARVYELQKLGADAVCITSDENFADCVRDFAGKIGPDIVIDFLGQSTFQQSFSILAPGGRYATCGTMTGPGSEISLLRLYSRQIELVGSTTGSIRDLRAALQASSEGKIKTVVDSEFAFDCMPQALDRHSKRGKFGKVKVVVSR
ncbi:MAG: zinc-binding dehydrogenase [Thermoplasmata archaeon]|nr:zinc-binding dehydrogenase [Candidatus Sysuiplasma jiujiangense]